MGFQNRRAKRKQEKKQEAYEAGQAQEALGYSEPSSPDFYNNGSGYYSDNSQNVPIQQPSAQFPLANGPPPPVASYNPQYTDPSTASMESLHRTMAAAQAASGHDDFHNFVDQHDSMPTFGGSIHSFSSTDRAQFPTPEESLDHFNNTQAYSYPSSFSNSLYINPSRSQSIAEIQSPEDASNHTPTPFDNFQNLRHESSVPQLMTSFPSQLLPSQSNDGVFQQNDEQFTQSPESIHESTLAIGFKYDIAESDESSVSPPGPSIAFKSPPPPMDIASRRKKVQVKPAALVADTLRGRPSMGPRTVSHAEGFRRGTESPASSPMRRIVSAGGNRNVLSGRIYKSGIESSQLSPNWKVLDQLHLPLKGVSTLSLTPVSQDVSPRWKGIKTWHHPLRHRRHIWRLLRTTGQLGLTCLIRHGNTMSQPNPFTLLPKTPFQWKFICHNHLILAP